MRYLMAALLVGAALWSGYWFYGARGVERGIVAWLDARHGDGWIAEFSGVETQGFPNRFDTTISNLELADPETGVAFAAPFFQLFRLSYKPRHLIAVWPSKFTLASPFQRLTISTQDARGSFVFGASDNWPIERASMVYDELAVSSDAGWALNASEARFAVRTAEDIANGLVVGFKANDLRPEGGNLGRLAQMGLLPASFGKVHLDATVGFDTQWDLDAIETQRPRITSIDLRLLQADWGQLEFWAAGEVTIDSGGRASGSVTIKAVNWKEILQIATAAGWVPEVLAPGLESGLSALATLSGSAKTLDAPLTLERGAVSFGPIPLGQLPTLRLR